MNEAKPIIKHSLLFDCAVIYSETEHLAEPMRITNVGPTECRGEKIRTRMIWTGLLGNVVFRIAPRPVLLDSKHGNPGIEKQWGEMR